MSIPGAGNPLLLGGAAGGYEIERSLRFNSADSAYLSRTPASAGNRKTWTWSGWVKRSRFGAYQSVFYAGSNEANRTGLSFADNETLTFFHKTGGSVVVNVLTTAVFRDPSAWYHVAISFDSTQATASQRLRAYVNGIQYLFGSNPVSLNDEYFINTTNSHFLGAPPQLAEFYSGYLADIHFIDGQALDPTSFGEFDDNGIWQPIEYTGTYGTNGFKLDFSDNSAATAAALGADSSGNGNNWTPNNLSVTAGAGNDSLVDTPTNYGTDTGAGGEVRGNYATLNPLDIIPGRTLPVISNGNLDASNGGGGDDLAHGTIAVSSGKWYFEMVAGTVPASNTHFVGWQVPVPSPLTGGLYRSSGVIYDFSATTTSAPTYTTNDIIGCMVDVDAGKVWFSKNGTYVNSGDPVAGTNAAFTFTAGSLITPAFGFDNIGSSCTASLNFGQRPFAYTAPSGFKALCTTNLPEPTIADGSTAMDVALYTGNGSTQSIASLDFSPDLVWIKERSSTSSHHLFDVIRGVQVGLFSDSTSAEVTSTTQLSSFDSNGFTTGPSGGTNESGQTYVAWTWDAGSSTVTNTDGTISSQVRANPSAGFSIVSWSAASGTVGHGLNAAPSFIVTKSRTDTFNWWCYHASLGTSTILLNSTSAAITSTLWPSLPTSTVFGHNTGLGTNNMVAYCFAPVAGYSAFGSYTGNGSADGPFVYTGHRSRFILIKRTDAAGSNWVLHDTERDTYNVATKQLLPSTSSAETDTSLTSRDILSNGFKLRGANAAVNASSGTYVYAAFAEHPFAYSRAR